MHTEIWIVDLRWLQTGRSKRKQNYWFGNVYYFSGMAFGISPSQKKRFALFLLSRALSWCNIHCEYSKKNAVLFDKLDFTSGRYICVDYVRIYLTARIGLVFHEWSNYVLIMFWSWPSHTQIMPQCFNLWPNHVQIVFQSCPNYVSIMSQSYSSHILIMSHTRFNHVQIMSQSCPNHVPIRSQSRINHVPITLQSFPNHVSILFNHVPFMFQNLLITLCLFQIMS